MKPKDDSSIDRAETLARWKAKDPADDGRFVVGVLSTGIYCLPSCPARTPKDENVRFFRDEEGARAGGLRACRRCKPDHFYRGYDPDREAVEALAERVRSEPGSFAGVPDLRRETGFGATKLNELFRRHYHTTPAAYLQRARVRFAADRLVRTKRKVLDVALEAGFESSSAFHEAFAARLCTTPGAYRKLAGASEFSLALPRDYRNESVLGMFGRDREGRTERSDGNRAAKALDLAGRPVVLSISSTTRFGMRVSRSCA